MIHALHAMSHARVVVQAMPLASIPVAINVVLRQFVSRRRFVFSGDPAVERGYSALPEAERAGHEVLQGLVHFGIDQHLPERALYLTILRDPVECAIALYFMALATPGHYLHASMTEGGWTLEDLIERGRPEIDNPQVRWLNPMPRERIPFGGVTPEMLEHAKRVIRERYIFGLAERVDESLVMFRRHFGWTDVSYSRSMLAQRPLAEGIAPQTAARLREINRFDTELHRYAAELFEERVRELGPEFAAEVGDFREQNERRSSETIWVAGSPISAEIPAGFGTAQDTVWLASYPRSGNTWLRFLLDACFFSPARYMQEVGRFSGELDWWVQEATRLNLPEDWIAYGGHETRRRYPRPEGCPSDLFLKSHYLLSERHPLRARTRAAVFLIRDPRDVMLSGMNFAELTQWGMGETEVDYARMYAAAGGDPTWVAQGYGTWAGHAASWLEQKEFPVLLVRYEDLKAEPGAQLRRVLEFIGATVEPERVERAVELCSLSRLRNLERSSRAMTAVPGLRSKDKHFFHKGLSGQSLSHLGEEVEAEFRGAFGADAARWGYTL